jgi:hypothetical protein
MTEATNRQTKSDAAITAWLGTLRVIGIASDDGLRTVTLALVETDGRRVRSLETKVATISPNRHGSLNGRTEALAEIVLQFMGNLVLQPFSIDVIGLSASITTECRSAMLARLTYVAVVSPCDLADPDNTEFAACIAAYLAACNTAVPHASPTDSIDRR